jgi:hypothetical protein
MTNEHYQKLARDFLDMWQNQVGSVVRDKQFIEAMLQMTKNWQSAYGQSENTTASRPAHAADAGHGDLAQLAFRIGMCEHRLAALEAAAAKPARSAKPNPSRRSGSRKTRK